MKNQADYYQNNPGRKNIEEGALISSDRGKHGEDKPYHSAYYYDNRDGYHYNSKQF